MPRRCPMPTDTARNVFSQARTGPRAGAALGCAAVLALFAGIAGPALAAEPDAAAKLFQRGCAGCHSERRVVRKVKAMPAADREARLRKFMEDHHAADKAERELVIRYLLARAAR
jgi:mono/diheme cytochrome c family protein